VTIYEKFNIKTMCTLAKVYVIVIVSCITVCHQLCLASCPAGKKLSSNATCEPCPHNSYISETNHTHTLCNDCTKSAPSFAELWYPCNATHNSVYRCINKTFNSNGPDILCQPCRTCTNLVRNCTYDQDSICCFGKNMILKELKSEETCINISSNYQYCCIDSEQTTVK
ncbi:tumor necrosis factor receptor superfamily member 10C, partial [Biomphalaria glabrata]